MPYSDPEAQKRYQREWYEARKSGLMERQKAKRNAVANYIRAYKEENNICSDCRMEFPPHILEFDHLRDKEFGLAKAWKHTTNIEVVQKEIEKCEIVCGNCHKHRTWLRSVKETQIPVKD